MNTIDGVLKSLSMLHEFNKRLRAFTFSTNKNTAIKSMEPTVATVTRAEKPFKGKGAPAAHR